MGIIYGLIDPNTKELRYIGQTTQSIKKRMYYHNGQAKKSGQRSHVYNWLNSLYTKNLQAEVLIIENNINKSNLDDLEIFYIQYFRFLGCNLTNLSSGGKTRGGFFHTEEHKQYLSTLYKGRLPWNTGKILTIEQKKNHKTPENFIHLSVESLKKRSYNQSITKSKKSKVSDEIIKFIRDNYPKYSQKTLAEMLNLRQDYISDVINFKIRKYV